MSCARGGGAEWEDFGELLKLSKSEEPRERLRALREFCPCKVRKDFGEVWDRIFEMAHDPDETVRYQVLHSLCDGSPHELEERIIPVLEEMYNDECEKIRRQARRVLATYRKVEHPVKRLLFANAKLLLHSRVQDAAKRNVVWQYHESQESRTRGMWQQCSPHLPRVLLVPSWTPAHDCPLASP